MIMKHYQHGKLFTVGLLASVILLTACSSNRAKLVDEYNLGADTTYFCDNARQFTAHFSQAGDAVTILYDGRLQTLYRDTVIPLYENRTYKLTVEEDETLTLARLGTPVLVGCKAYKI